MPKILVSVLLLALVVVGGFSLMSKKDPVAEAPVDTNVSTNDVSELEVPSVTEEVTAGEQGGEMEGIVVEEKEKMETSPSSSTGSYEIYAPEKLAKAEAGDVVLFFRASWCPSCRALDSDIKANASKIPGTLTILDVDYDKYTALKQKYGVTYQHTMVQVDKDGNQIAKWSGSSTLVDLVSKVK